jgi:hypothetical protein
MTEQFALVRSVGIPQKRERAPGKDVKAQADPRCAPRKVRPLTAEDDLVREMTMLVKKCDLNSTAARADLEETSDECSAFDTLSFSPGFLRVRDA